VSFRSGAGICALLALIACENEPLRSTGFERKALAELGCAPAPDYAEPEAVAALARLNELRVRSGLACAQHDERIASAARSHCAYFVRNADDPACSHSPHREVASCQGFTGERFTDRMQAAGFPGEPVAEVMTYVSDGAEAIDLWMDSIWHRLPLIQPHAELVGYGRFGVCDTLNIGRSQAQPTEQVVKYPYDGQEDVPVMFAGNEAPEPPRPPNGWPSGYPISLVAPGFSANKHTLSRVDDAFGDNIPHTFLSAQSEAAQGLMFNELVMYADEPLQSDTWYRATFEGVRDGEAVSFRWTFKTR